jgi:tRNA threonylcarbamoyladenosine biosynthesis protein TsaE
MNAARPPAVPGSGGRDAPDGRVTCRLRVPTSADMKALGRRLAGLLRAGDLVLLTGPLGAGKTTLVQGIGEGLGVRGPVTSPTFVIARVHPSLSGGPALVHADAYRLAGPAEVDDLDLDASLPDCVTVVEWGGGMAEGLAADRLEVTITPDVTEGAGEPRLVHVAGLGRRWQTPGESALLACLAGSQAV